MRHFAFVLLMSVTSMAAADGLDVSKCAFADVPQIADGATAAEADMVAAGKAVRAYLGEMQSALDCLRDMEKSMGGDITEDQQKVLTDTYNSGVDSMNTVADNYNAQIKAYKAQ